VRGKLRNVSPSAPVLFVSHGAPTAALEDNPWTRALADFGRRHRPAAVAVVSAHWEERQPVRVGSTERNETLHDFGGFAAELYAIRYPAPGDPWLAANIASRLEKSGIPAQVEPDRPLDHGAWVPLRFLFPDADVPVVEVSLPRPRHPELVSRMGAVLSPLRDDGVLLLGSGGGVHNLSAVALGERNAPSESWALEFDRWLADRVAARDLPALLAWRERAPHAALAHPTPEHLDPLLFAAGASRGDDRVEVLHEGIEYRTLSTRTFALL
jgi:4,5-DOPA dioxygenase extradiol